ncbi:MAG: hypothetical protein UT05_C0003G0102 [Parcubacteria group bacterium GW2011_GWF2_38_76]|nr:MAG: hypothetical protein UT05_C0003G0102 [Parcubacteria group bacterium GW2011_GWF2_38_76]
MFMILLSAFITMGRSFFLSFEAVDDEVRCIVTQKTIDRSEEIFNLALTGILLFVIAFSMMATIK